MRLDVFLKISRLVPRRTVAQALCDGGKVFLNGSPAKSSKEVKVGDVLSIQRGDSTTTVRIEVVPLSTHLPKQSASALYSIVTADI